MRDEERYRAIVESAPDGVWMLDADDRTSYVNRAMTDMIGMEPEEMLGRRPTEFVDDPTRDTVQAALDRRRAGLTERYELTFKRSDGSELITEISATPLFDEDGSYAGSTAIVIDATERHRARQARAELEARLQQAQRLETVGQLAGGIAHDFNNLLAVMLNYAHFVHEQLPEDSALRDDVEQITRAAARASELTRQLLIFSRRDPATPQAVDVNALIEETERLLKHSLGERVSLSSSPCSSRCFVHVDPAQLEHVLLNLVVNARDAMPGGGAIEITTELEDDRIVISVSDDGPGMEPEVAARAFEPFFTTKPKGAGTGLGLATVYGTIASAGGEARIETEPGSGTTIRLSLPGVSEPEEVTPDPSTGGATVLLVEDEDAVRELTRRILTKGGFSCLDAPSADAALELYRESPDDIDLVLTDVVMPGMSGPELAERIEALPVLFMSGYAGDAAGALPEGAPPLLEKPFSADELLAAVRAAL
ncbi:MAG TPA: PAS domain S-box protein [Thermoleophilaceae bacterium]|jgi:PAS domain S-box-containing protein